MDAIDNAAVQEDELVGLQAIFGNDVRIERGHHLNCEVHVPSLEATVKVVVHFQLNAHYPSHQPPEIMITAHHLLSDKKEWIRSEMLKLFQQNVPVLYECIEWLQLHTELYKKAEPEEERAELEAVVIESPGVDSKIPNELQQRIVHGEPFTEKKSTFQAHVCEISSAEEVRAVMQYLLSKPKIQHATHNILAYRIFNPTTQAFIQDCDDDGETAAGGRLLHLLQVADVRNVVVCVSRWFGGVLLGPVRFSHINNAARELLVKQGYIAPSEKKKR